MSDWDSFVACVDEQDAQVSQFLRNEGLAAFNGSKDVAMAGVNAIIAWWNGLNPAVKFALKYAQKKLSDAAKKKLSDLIVGAIVVATMTGAVHQAG